MRSKLNLEHEIEGAYDELGVEEDDELTCWTQIPRSWLPNILEIYID
jgi:hypothetical protein